MIAVEATKLDGVRLVRLSPYEDFRGWYIETYNEDMYRENGIDMHFVQDDISISARNVLRGIHGDAETWKLISCLEGQFYLVVVNCDETSPQFKQWQAFTLSEHNRIQILIPPKFGNGHLVLSERTIFHYKQTTYYNPKGQFTYRWNDESLGIWWPSKTPIVSQRDERGHF